MSDHFDGRRFFNPGDPERHGLPDLLRWLLTRRGRPWPRWLEDPAPDGPPPAPGPGEVGVTFVNHSTFLLQLGGVNLLTDPVWSERASPLRRAGPRRVRRPGVAFEHLPEVHAVLVSHNHYDHMDLPTLRRLQTRFRPLFVTGLGNRAYLTARGLGRVEELDWWQSIRVAGEGQVTLTPARHFSQRGLFDRDLTLWGGFLIRAGARTVYFAGDSGFGDHFKEVRRRAGPIDLALLPIGAYEPRWFMHAAHVNPDEAVRAHQDLAPARSVAMHFGTFRLTDEGVDEPVRALREALAARGVPEKDFRVLAFGETIILRGEREA